MKRETEMAYWERLLNGLVYELHFPEELHVDGLRLFDLVAEAGIPQVPHAKAQSRVEGATESTASSPESLRAFAASRETDFLPRLRQNFEELYDSGRPLRIALDKLQTLDTVRIIEGKA